MKLSKTVILDTIRKTRDPDFLDSMSNHPDYQIVHAVALSDHAHDYTKDKLADHSDEDVVRAVASTAKSPDTIKKLVNHKSPYVQLGIASNPNTPPDVIHELANKWIVAPLSYDNIRSGQVFPELFTNEIVGNRNTSSNTIHAIATQDLQLDADTLVDMYEHPNVSPVTKLIIGRMIPDAVFGQRSVTDS